MGCCVAWFGGGLGSVLRLAEQQSVVAGPRGCWGDAQVTTQLLGTLCQTQRGWQPHGPSWGSISFRGYYIHMSAHPLFSAW